MSKLGSVRITKNSGAVVGIRSVVNLLEGVNITLTVTDDAVNAAVYYVGLLIQGAV